VIQIKGKRLVLSLARADEAMIKCQIYGKRGVEKGEKKFVENLRIVENEAFAK
jgi:hypothetical protein